MRRILTLLVAITGFFAVTATAAQAAPHDPASPAGKTSPNGTPPRTLTRSGSISVKLPARLGFRRTGVTTLQDPPGGGCQVGDVGGNWNATYDGDTLVLESVAFTYSAKVLCTTTALGQSLKAITITSSLWHNGTNIDSGTPFSCVNCNLGNSPGEWTGAGPSAAGPYWVGGVEFLYLPDGWYWSNSSSPCQVTSNTSVLECTPVSDVTTVPGTYGG